MYKLEPKYKYNYLCYRHKSFKNICLSCTKCLLCGKTIKRVDINKYKIVLDPPNKSFTYIVKNIICKKCHVKEKSKKVVKVKKQKDEQYMKFTKYLCEKCHEHCKLIDSPGCCACRDLRSFKYNNLYDGYIDGIGYVKEHKTRWNDYCPSCKDISAKYYDNLKLFTPLEI